MSKKQVTPSHGPKAPHKGGAVKPMTSEVSQKLDRKAEVEKPKGSSKTSSSEVPGRTTPIDNAQWTKDDSDYVHNAEKSL